MQTVNSQDFFASVIGVLPEPVVVTTPEGRILTCNGAWTELARQLEAAKSSDSYPERVIPCITGENYRNSFARQLEKVASGTDHVATAEYRIRVAGAIRWHQIRTIRFDDTGRPVLFITHEDITARREADQAYRDSQARLSLFIQKSPLAVIGWNDRFEVTEWNEAAERIFGWKASEMMGKSSARIIPPSAQQAVATVWEGLLKGTSGFRSTNENLTSDGRTILCDWYNTPLVSPDGRILGVTSLCMDVTDRVKSEDSLRRRDALLEAAAGAANCFLTMRDPDEATREALARLGRATDVDRAYIYEFYAGTGNEILLREKYEWCREGIASQISQPGFDRFSLDRAGYGDWIERFRLGQPVAHHLRELKDSPIRRFVQASGNRSFILVPVFSDDALYGLIGFDSCSREREWTRNEKAVLFTVAATVGGAFSRIRREQRARQREERLRRQQNTLVRLASRSAIEDDIQKTYERVAIAAAETMQVDRVSVWLKDPSGQQIDCACMYWSQDGRMETGGSLRIADIPAYARALEGNRAIAAGDAAADPRSRELLGSYLKPANVKSILDAPIRLHGKVIGVLCHDHMGPTRHWELDEENYAGSLADLLSLAIETSDLKQTEQKLSALVRALPGQSYVVSAEGRFELVSGEISPEGPDPGQFIGKHVNDLLGGTAASTVMDGIRRTVVLRQPQRFEYALKRDRADQWFECHTSPLIGAGGAVDRVVLVTYDVTDRKRIGEQLAEAQRMEAMGQLVGGVAHDFNNLLNVILGHGEILRMEVAPSNPLYPDIDGILKAGARGAKLTQQLLAFARREVIETRVVDPAELLSRLVPMLERLVGERVRLVTRIDSGLPAIRVSVSQMEQAIVNLMVNAVDAMPSGGTLTVYAQLSGPDARILGRGQRLSGYHVRVSVSDTGTGIHPDVLPRIFEPFFTTKGVGKGTGLGLASVLGIVQQNGGVIDVQTQWGTGTRFDLYFPAVAERPVPIELSQTKEPELPRARPGEQILLVEDEDSLRMVNGRTLAMLGYGVLSAASGEEALALAAGHKSRIDLLLTDVVMPGITGPQLAEKLRETRPGTDVLFVSGYTNSIVLQHGVAHGETHFLQKPVSNDILARKIREILDARAESGFSPSLRAK